MFKKLEIIQIFILIILSINKINAQDLVVLNNNDSLNCKVKIERNTNYIKILYIDSGNIKSQLLNYQLINSIIKDFYVLKPISQKFCDDTIFTNEGDSIICNIYEDKIDWYINYELSNKSKQTINYNQVLKVYKCNEVKKLKTEQPSNLLLKDIKTKIFVSPKYNIGFFANSAFKLGNLSIVAANNNREHFFKLRLNFGFFTDFQMVLTKSRRFYLGFQIGYHGASISSNNVNFQGLNKVYYFGELNSSISFVNIGPNITFRLNKNYKINNYSIQFGINSVFYNDKLNILNYNLYTNGNGLTQSLNFVYENNVSKVLNFRLITGINAGGINTLNITENSATFKTNVKGKEGIGLSGLNFGIGLNYLINKKNKY